MVFTNIGGVPHKLLKKADRIAMDGEERPRYGSIQHSAPGDQYKAHPGRFYVLTVFSLFALVQSLGWLTFGTIPDESYKELGLTDIDITLIAGIANGVANGVHVGSSALSPYTSAPTPSMILYNFVTVHL